MILKDEPNKGFSFLLRKIRKVYYENKILGGN